MVQELELDLLRVSDAQPSRVARSIALSPRSEERNSEQRLINIVIQEPDETYKI